MTGPDVPHKKKEPTRVDAYDALRGLSILGVVLGHCAGLGWGFRHVDGEQWQFWYSLLLRNSLMVALPIFLFISGYWLVHAPCQTYKDYKEFLQRRVSRVFVPYLFWSIVFIALFALAAREFHLREALRKLLLGEALGPFYFIQVMLQLYLLTPVYKFWLARKRGLAEILVVHLVFLATLYVLRIAWWPNAPFLYVKLPFLCWGFWYAFGMAARTRPALIQGYNVPLLAGVTFLLLILNMAESGAFLWLENLRSVDHEELIVSDVRFFAEAYALACLLLLLQLRHVNWPGWLVWYGKVSFGIFFIHGVFLLFFHKAMMAVMPGLFAVQPVYQTLLALVVTAACTVVILASHRIFRKWINERIFGF